MKFAITAILAMLLVACSREEEVGTREEAAFKAWLDRAGSYVSELPCDSLGGVWRVLENDRDTRTTGNQVQADSEVNITFESYVFSSSLNLDPTLPMNQRPTPFYTNNADLVAEKNLEVNWSTEPHTTRVDELASGLKKGLTGAWSGDSLLLLMLSAEGYGTNAMGAVPEYAPLIFRVVINEVK